MSKKKAFEPVKFSHDGGDYEFVYPSINMKNENGQPEVISAEAAVERPQILDRLIESGSQAIRQLGGETPEATVDISDLTVKELKAVLDDAGVEYDSNAKKAQLVELVENLDQEVNNE